MDMTEGNKMKLLAEAISLAAKAHCGQTRRDGTPYIYHPLMVAEIVKRNGASLDCQMAAVLHDTLEDTTVKEEDIARFGGNVVRAVKLLTRTKGTDEADYVNAILKDPIAKAVKEADKINNLRESVLCEDKGFRKRYVKKAKKYYYGKFSTVLDTVIDLAAEGKTEKADVTDAVIMVPKDIGVIPAMPVPKGGIIPAMFTPKGAHTPGKNRRIKDFDARDPENVFYIDSRYDDSYICDPDSESGDTGETQVYALTRGGWKAEYRDMMVDFDMYIEQTREEMDAIILDLYERGWFHDGVEVEKL